MEKQSLGGADDEIDQSDSRSSLEKLRKPTPELLLGPERYRPFDGPAVGFERPRNAGLSSTSVASKRTRRPILRKGCVGNGLGSSTRTSARQWLQSLCIHELIGSGRLGRGGCRRRAHFSTGSQSRIEFVPVIASVPSPGSGISIFEHSGEVTVATSVATLESQVAGSPPARIEGHYWTDRSTAGELVLSDRHPRQRMTPRPHEPFTRRRGHPAGPPSGGVFVCRRALLRRITLQKACGLPPCVRGPIVV